MFSLEFDAAEASPRLATLVIDRPGEKVNAIAPDSLDKVDGLFDTIEGEPSIVGVVVVSRKRDNFVAGADVDTFATATDRREIEAFARRGHAVLSRVAKFKRPVVAAIDGACLGAGLELALACHYRVCSDAAKTVLGVPEINLGLFPGGGGVSRLPRLLGLRTALDLVLTGRNVRPRAARAMGLVDEVVARESLIDAARAAVLRLARGGAKVSRELPFMDGLLQSNPVTRAWVFAQARKSVQKKTLGLYPAPFVALDVMEKGMGLALDDALRLEPPAFAELAVGEVSRALVSLFVRSNELKKARMRDASGQALEGRPVTRLGLLGGGFMGADIAIVAAEHDIQTRIREVAVEPLSRALAHVRTHFDRRAKSVGEPRVFKARSRVSGGLDLAGFETMDLVIEAVPEVLELKQDVFVELESRVPETTILASNTSAIPITSIGAKMKHRDRLVGLHFFSPVPKMPLLEIVRTAETSPETIAACIEFAVRIGKTPIVVRDGPGFYTTRVLGVYLIAALEMVREGHRIEDVDLGARKMGWPVGPLALLDEVGIDVGVKVAKTLAAAFPERIRPVVGVDAFLADQRLGRKSGKGFYDYAEKGKKRPDARVYAFFTGRPSHPPSIHPDELGERLTLVAALEAVRCLQDGIISDARQGDIGAVFGFGYPPLRGGPFRHLDNRGLETVLHRVRRLQEQHETFFSPPALLEELAHAGKRFADVKGEA